MTLTSLRLSTLLTVALLASPVAVASENVHWAFQVPVRPRLPKVANQGWPQSAIDYFVLARLEAARVEPSPPADQRTLVRRLSLDLRGLPPTAEEVSRFLTDNRPGAYERLVRRLMASVHFGERWGRYWLDVAHYADSDGYTIDGAREIWRYRDWVIDAFNRDLRLDQFVVEQFAGDLLPGATRLQRVATGFLRNTMINGEGGTDPEEFRVEAVADRLHTMGVGLLGMTLSCARCHDHKSDAISHREYYQLFAFLNNCDEISIDAPTAQQTADGTFRERIGQLEKIDVREAMFWKHHTEPFLLAQRNWEAGLSRQDKITKSFALKQVLQIPREHRSSDQVQLTQNHFRETKFAREKFPELGELARLRDEAAKVSQTLVVRERAEARKTYIHLRGQFLDRGDRVEPGVPEALHPLPGNGEVLTRLDLARWLVARDNPLTPRVLVNRFWQQLFGTGIVATENDFGTQGELPSHRGLLDWLARELVEQGWSMKHMIRLMVMSATYRQQSVWRPELEPLDPTNRLLARQRRLRLDAEVIRDVALAAAGLLSPTVGGPSVFPPQPEGVFAQTQAPKSWDVSTGADRYRRGMYTHFYRSSPYPALMVFDFPESNVTCTRRVQSNTPLQALALANDTVFVECARAVGIKLAEEQGSSDQDRIDTMFRRCLARPAEVEEASRLLQFVELQRRRFGEDRQAAEALLATAGAEDQVVEKATWVAAARVVLNLDEFITRE